MQLAGRAGGRNLERKLTLDKNAPDGIESGRRLLVCSMKSPKTRQRYLHSLVTCFSMHLGIEQHCSHAIA